MNELNVLEPEYSKAGDFLSNETWAIAGSNVLGGEFALPTPGALALLGIAGLMGTRRRRRR